MPNIIFSTPFTQVLNYYLICLAKCNAKFKVLWPQKPLFSKTFSKWANKSFYRRFCRLLNFLFTNTFAQWWNVEQKEIFPIIFSRWLKLSLNIIFDNEFSSQKNKIFVFTFSTPQNILPKNIFSNLPNVMLNIKFSNLGNTKFSK